ncbi:alpha/beta hydrolase family protein [Litorihabitans aurantiacus]|uniref:Alpha/beta hydrolase n=1 Tax=Litorihabitans aurantiacus TaxID=1930061 RepID=A0AA37XBF9_9MICO|nr:hypothetical protein [Litorihabitans aurantiacus]GMA30959.1 hypothetical protein GCM10025875_09510 [Litorihabitans aurantiacus]
MSQEETPGVETQRRPGARRRALAARLSTPPMRTAAAVLVGVLVLALVGTSAGPRWNPEPVSATVTVASPDVWVGAGPADGAGDGAAVLGRYDTRSRIVEVELEPADETGRGGVTTDVLIVEPVDAPRPAPAVVFLHGAGTGLADAFAEHATAFASAGIVAVSPSKRLDTYSTLHRDYEAMAADYGRTLELARTLDGVDPDRVGLYAESEGAWVAPVLAAGDDDVAFVALVSAPVVPPRQQAAFAVDAYLREVGVPQTLLRAIPRATGAHWPGGSSRTRTSTCCRTWSAPRSPSSWRTGRRTCRCRRSRVPSSSWGPSPVAPSS